MGVGFDNLTKTEFTAKAEDMLKNKERGYVVTPNAEIVYESIQDDGFRALLNDASMVLPDGAGVVLGAKILGTPIKEKVAGIEFGEEVCKLLAKNNGRLYLLGSKPGIAKAAGEKLAAKYPGLVICGVADGYFKDEKAVIEKINEAKPDVLFVCLGAPKQEKFMVNHRNELQVKLMAGLGGSLDAFAGTVKRAPKWMIDLSLEWLYRLIKEPWRFKRMLRLPKFLWKVIGKRLKGK
jgi:N-acetylglucosaminyldiphosphoundecaprenol N-acetyl-beta-D-mannosaminyltransferase